MTETRVRTAKGEREAERILDAATTVLARDGFGGATLGRIATEAGVDKRMVVYYFGGRESLLAQVVQRLGERIAANVEAAVIDTTEPEAMAAGGIQVLWDCAIEDPVVPRAYLALLTSSGEAPEVRAALLAVKRTFEAMFAGRVDALADLGYRLNTDREGFVKYMMANVRGLLLEWAEEGDSAGLESSLEQWKRVAVGCFDPPG